MTGAAEPVIHERPPADLIAPPEPAAGRSVWAGLHGCARAMAVARLAMAARRPVLLIAATPAHVNRYLEELPFFCPDVPIHILPDWETLPYDQFSPYQDIISMRLRTLSELAEGRAGIYIVATSTALHRLAPRDWVTAQHFSLRQGQQLDRDGFLGRLEKSGYRRVSEVLEHGDYAVRGSLFDVFPMGSDVPVRIDLLDDDIETLRSFNVETQRSGAVLDSIEILPAREFSLGQASITAFRQQWRTRFEGRPTNAPIYNDVSEGLAPAGIEYYLPLFFERTDSVFDYLPEAASLVIDAEFGDAAAYFADEVAERFEQLQHDPQRPLLPPGELFFDRTVIDDAATKWRSVELSGTETEDRQAEEFGTRPAGQVPVDSRAAEPFGAVRRFVDGFDGRVLFVAESAGRRETISDLFRRHDLPYSQVDDWAGFVAGDTRVGLAVAPLDEGVILRQPPIAIIAESQLFGRRASQQRRRRRSATDPDAIIRNLTELHIDAPVVHEAHGVGRYKGLEQLEAGGIVSEYIKLEYADGDKLYVPVASLHML
ncbi:MAG: transcription-repair coupling factor, partial [Gammaproteobacteria bacterium]|nr:transcription-repair coupling factor [Gammaproteobacteria bacterium]